MATYAKVRRMHYRERLSISEIARRTSLSRNTIKRWLREPARAAMTYPRRTATRKIDPHVSWLHQALALDAQRPRNVRARNGAPRNICMRNYANKVMPVVIPNSPRRSVVGVRKVAR